MFTHAPKPMQPRFSFSPPTILSKAGQYCRDLPFWELPVGMVYSEESETTNLSRMFSGRIGRLHEHSMNQGTRTGNTVLIPSAL